MQRGIIFFIITMCLTSSLRSPTIPDGTFLQEWECAALTLWHEARGEPLEGVRAVLDVVENRASKSGKSTCHIMTAHKQFSFYKYGMDMTITNDMIILYNKIVDMRRVLPHNVFHYHATTAHPIWAKRTKLVAQIGRHKFYRNIK